MTSPALGGARVAWAGAQRDVLAGHLGATIGLADLRDVRHLYALGPLTGLTGEITVFAGEALIARVLGGEVAVEGGRDETACFLVYADVPAWHWATLSSPLNTAEVEPSVVERAAALGVDPGAPLAFSLRGRATALSFHVLDKRDGMPHSPERHEEAKVLFELRDREVEVIGFRSTAHRGIFTPRDSNVHMHFRSADGRASGHVEGIALRAGWRLGLPTTAPA